MPTLKNLTVRYLRELARKHLGKGHSKLKTKDELLSALRRIFPRLGAEGAGKVEKSAARPRKQVKTSPQTPSAKRAAPAASPERVTVVHFPKPMREVAAPPPPVETGHRAALPPPYAPPAAIPSPLRPQFHPAEPLVEGFFVAKIAGEDEARRHHLTEDQVPPPVHTRSALHYDEQLPALPWEYDDDRVVMMARDPHTLHLYWEFRSLTREQAFHGLDSPRVLLHVYESGRVVRTLDVALESRGYYVHGLTPGRTYRAELHAVGRDGSWRRIGPSAGEVTLPSDDISADTSVRFMRVPWGVPLNRLKEGVQTGRVRVEVPAEPPKPLELTHYRWVPLPNSGSWQLVSWNERIFGEVTTGAPTPQGIRLGASEVLGGGSGSGSWHLGASWQVGGSWQLGHSGQFAGSPRGVAPGASAPSAPPVEAPPAAAHVEAPAPSPSGKPAWSLEGSIAFPPHPERKS